MRNRSRAILEGLLWIAAVAATAAQATAQAAEAEDPVRETFERYKGAVLAGDGATAAGLVSKSTIDYFGQMQKLALHADPTQVRAQPPADQLQILAFRQRIDNLAKLTPRAVFAHTIDAGWIEKGSMSAQGLGPVSITQEVAEAEVLSAGQPTGARYRFVRESDAWRLDLVNVLATQNQLLKSVAERRGVSEEELILSLVESASGKPVPETIWNPLVQSPK